MLKSEDMDIIVLILISGGYVQSFTLSMIFAVNLFVESLVRLGNLPSVPGFLCLKNRC